MNGGWRRGARRAWPTLVLLVVTSRALANGMIVDTRTLRMNDLVTITVSLEGDFAANDFVDVPLQNLEFVGEPSIASEFSWTNGEVVRRKVFRYRGRPLSPGPAGVGPVELTSQDGGVQILPAIALQVEADRAAASNDPRAVLRELIATGREPFFVVAEVDNTTPYVGQGVAITWVMYNAAVVQQWQVVSVPRLADFWTEELGRDDEAERMYLDDVMVQRLPIRRVVLFPLRSGSLRVDGMTAEGAILRRTRRGPFSLFEGDVVEAAFTSAPVDLEVKPLPPGPAPDAVGQFALTCERPIQKGSGPVVWTVSLAGLGNVRAAVPPRLERGVGGTLQVQGGEVTVSRDDGPPRLSRRWQYLVLPAKTGALTIPALEMKVFDPVAGLSRELRCASVTLDVVAAPAAVAAPVATAEPESRSLPWGTVLAGVVVLAALLLAWLPGVRELRIRREARAIVADATPADIRARIEQRVKIDARERSDRGDALRALHSFLDASERDRDISENGAGEIERRVRDVLRSRA